jgi:hypothetical protein
MLRIQISCDNIFEPKTASGKIRLAEEPIEFRIKTSEL